MSTKCIIQCKKKFIYSRQISSASSFRASIIPFAERKSGFLGSFGKNGVAGIPMAFPERSSFAIGVAKLSAVF
jgi:hypothetical protein